MGDLSLFSAVFQPMWCHTEAPEKPNFLFKVPLTSQEKHEELYRSGKGVPDIEIWLCQDIPPFWANYMIFWDDVRIPHLCLWTTFEVWEKPPAHA